MHHEIWLKQLKSFLRPFDKRTWTDIASNFLSEPSCKKIKNLRELKQKEGGFVELKRQLSKSYVPKRKKYTEDKFSIRHLISRKQTTMNRCRSKKRSIHLSNRRRLTTRESQYETY